MAHPALAASDPIYWVAWLVLIGASTTIVGALRWGSDRLRWRLINAAVLLALPAGLYVLMGTACYVGGDCV